MDEQIRCLHEMDKLFQENFNRKIKSYVMVFLVLLLLLGILTCLDIKYHTYAISKIPEHDMIIITITYPYLRSHQAIKSILADAITKIEKEYQIIDSDYGNYPPPAKPEGMIFVVKPKIPLLENRANL